MYSTPTDLNYIPLVSANTRPHQQHWLHREREREREKKRGGGEETESIICIHSSVGPRPPLTISVIEPLHIYIAVYSSMCWTREYMYSTLTDLTESRQ